MKDFIRFYSWGTNMKFHMAIYTLVLVIMDSLVLWLMGERSLPILTLLEMLLVSLAVAVVETCIFPQNRDWAGAAMVRRTALWALMCNLGFIGGWVVFDWFSGVPVWGAALLVLFLEGGLAAMWFGEHVALRRDTQRLNRKLQEYKNET